jgi:aryl-alcohol dehydrogenase-like predicted oxidoreductase
MGGGGGVHQTQLGAQGPVVGRIGLGLAALGRPGYVNLGHGDDLGNGPGGQGLPVDQVEARCRALLDRARAAGVRYFDTARSYGMGEAFLGRWLRDRALFPDGCFVASKWGYTYTAGWRAQAAVHERKDHGLDVLRRQWSETQQTLGAALDLYQVHSATTDSGFDRPEVLDELRRIRREAGVRIGLSVTGPAQARTVLRALEINRRGGPLFDAVQATFNPLEPSAGGVLAEAARQGLAVVVKEAMANGRLGPRGATREAGWEPARWRRYADQADRLGVGVDALALAWVLDHRFVAVALSGAVTEAQLDANLRADGLLLDDEARAVLGGLAEPAEAYWATRAGLSWS